MKLTFKHGIHPKERKELAADSPIEVMPAGAKVYIPLIQHIGAPAEACVAAGDRVKAGTLVGKATSYVSANVFSSVSGTVSGIVRRTNAAGRKIPHVVIDNDGEYEEETLPPLVDPKKEEIIARCKEAGIVGMGGATFPTHVKLESKTPIKALIINGSECEPYITTDYRLMLERPENVVSGIMLLAKALGVDTVLVGIEGNKKDAIDRMIYASDGIEGILIHELKTKYPQGGEKQLIYALTKEKVPNGGLPSDVGYIVLNISTAYAVYEACVLGRPCYARFMTVSGEAIARPANLYVRTGVPFSEVVDLLGVKEEYVKAVSGGPMMGISLSDLTPSVSKGSSALLLLTEREIRAVQPTTCINCARCASVCPMNLMPMMTDALILQDKIKEAKEYYPMSCIECGCCAYVCPAKRPLVQSQRLAKKLIRELKI